MEIFEILSLGLMWMNNVLVIFSIRKTESNEKKPF